MITITASCHGETETKHFQVTDLRSGKSIRFFEQPEEV